MANPIGNANIWKYQNGSHFAIYQDNAIEVYRLNQTDITKKHTSHQLLHQHARKIKN